MKTKSRIELTDTPISAMLKMVDGNPGAITVLTQLFKETPKIDPDDAFGGLSPILHLDDMGVYGPRIWMLYKDACGQDVKKMITVLRANQLGFISDKMIEFAIDGDVLFDHDDLIAKVQKELPNFAKTA